MSTEVAPSQNRTMVHAVVRRVVLGHQIRPGDHGLARVGRVSNVITAVASLLVTAGVIGAPIFLTVAELVFHGARSTAEDLWTFSLLAIAAGLTLRFVGAVVNLYAQSFGRPRSRLSATFITVGFAAFLVVGGFLLFWGLALTAAVIAL